MKARNLFKVLAVIMSLAVMFTCAGCGNTTTTSEGEIITEEVWEDDELVDGSEVTGTSGTTSGSVQGGTNGGSGSGGSGTSGGSGSAAQNTSGNKDNLEGEKAQPIDNPYANIAKYKGKTVKFATWIDHKSNESARVLKSFKDKYGIDVELVSVPQVGYMSKLVGLISSGQAPDVFVDNSEFPVSLKIAQPMNKYINIKDSFWSQAHLDYGTINGNTYIVNGENSNWNLVAGMIYHKKTAEDAGVTTPDDYKKQGNWNWNTLAQFCKDFASIPGEHYGGYLVPEDLAATAGTGYVTFSNGKFVSGIGNSKLTEAVKTIADLNKSGYMMDSTKQSFFCDGTQALTVMTSWVFTKSAVAWETLKPEDMGFIEIPGPANGETYALQNMRGYGICKNAKNPEAAAYFLRYFLDINNYDTNEIYKNASVSVPMIEAVRKANASRKKTIVVSENAMTLVNSKVYSEMQKELKQTDPAQISAYLQTKSGVANNAVTKANNLYKQASK